MNVFDKRRTQNEHRVSESIYDKSRLQSSKIAISKTEERIPAEHNRHGTRTVTIERSLHRRYAVCSTERVEFKFVSKSMSV